MLSLIRQGFMVLEVGIRNLQSDSFTSSESGCSRPGYVLTPPPGLLGQTLNHTWERSGRIRDSRFQIPDCDSRSQTAIPDPRLRFQIPDCDSRSQTAIPDPRFAYPDSRVNLSIVSQSVVLILECGIPLWDCRLRSHQSSASRDVTKTGRPSASAGSSVSESFGLAWSIPPTFRQAPRPESRGMTTHRDPV